VHRDFIAPGTAIEVESAANLRIPGTVERLPVAPANIDRRM